MPWRQQWVNIDRKGVDMAEKNEQFKRFINRTLAEATGDPGQAAQPGAATINMLVGSVGGDVIIMGEVPPGALELVLGRRRNAEQG